jgi:glucose-6-phosphate isomerase
VHMGMGGSSLAPLVFKRSFRRPEGGLPLIVLDTTDPATILDVERRIPIERTLFIVASKSGTTAESRAFGEYFYTKVRQIKGDRAGENFVAITDPGTPLAKLAAQRNFRRTFLNMPDIGGRYSALSYFGLIPATLMGVEVSEVLARALLMTHACAGCVPARENPGLVLGSVMEELARRGRDKVTFLMPEGIATLGMWLEQLLAESTGKEGVGLVPIAGEPVGDPSLYGDDRLFIHFRLEQEVAPALEQAVRALRDAGRPVVTIVMKDRLDIAQEFFRWEFATATAGALMTINAFDQPNVQESKDNTKRLLEMIRNQQRLPEETQAAEQDSLRFYADGKADSATDLLQHFLAQECDGDYAALLAYLPEEPAVDQALRAIRLLLRDNLHLATTLGYGPRFLHSTGQLHKGGSNTGLFLQLTADGARDVDVPRQPYTFGTFKRAQALGDLRALREHGRRAVHVHLGADPAQGLQTLQNMLAACLQTPAQV